FHTYVKLCPTSLIESGEPSHCRILAEVRSLSQKSELVMPPLGPSAWVNPGCARLVNRRQTLHHGGASGLYSLKNFRWKLGCSTVKQKDLHKVCVSEKMSTGCPSWLVSACAMRWAVGHELGWCVPGGPGAGRSHEPAADFRCGSQQAAATHLTAPRRHPTGASGRVHGAKVDVE